MNSYDIFVQYSPDRNLYNSTEHSVSYCLYFSFYAATVTSYTVTQAVQQQYSSGILCGYHGMLGYRGRFFVIQNFFNIDVLETSMGRSKDVCTY